MAVQGQLSVISAKKHLRPTSGAGDIGQHVAGLIPAACVPAFRRSFGRSWEEDKQPGQWTGHTSKGSFRPKDVWRTEPPLLLRSSLAKSVPTAAAPGAEGLQRIELACCFAV